MHAKRGHLILSVDKLVVGILRAPSTDDAGETARVSATPIGMAARVRMR
jgi:hypothetical protein